MVGSEGDSGDTCKFSKAKLHGTSLPVALLIPSYQRPSGIHLYWGRVGLIGSLQKGSESNLSLGSGEGGASQPEGVRQGTDRT